MILILLFIFAEAQYHNIAGFENKTHIPVKLDKNTVLISYRLDDISFLTKDKLVLEGALCLARKYNVTFDLAIIAQSFDRYCDSETFKIYQNNQDVFEIAAHGLDHQNPINAKSYAEFYDFIAEKNVPADIQEDHIRKMKQIFERHNLMMATKIFILPCGAGDFNTVSLAQKYGYKLITLWRIPLEVRQEKNITCSEAMVGVPQKEVLTQEDISKCKNGFFDLLKKGHRKIQVFTHPINYLKPENMERLISEFKNLAVPGLKKKFGFISDGVTKN